MSHIIRASFFQNFGVPLYLFISLSKYDYLHLVTVTLNDEVKNLKHIDKLYKNIQIVSEVFIKIFY